MNEGVMRFYTDSEIDLLIDEISEIAKEAIEQAAAEAARAAALASVEREAAHLQAKAAHLQAKTAALREAQRWRMEYETTKSTWKRNALIAGLICFAGGFVSGLVIR